MKNRFTAALLALFTLLPLGAAPEQDPLEIPDTDEGLPGAGPLRRSDWFRGVWRKRRGSWLDRTEEQKGSVVFLGDSITQGWGDDFGGAFGKLKVANRGISGDTSRGLLVRLKEDVLALDPKAVVLMIGANDLAEKAKGEIVFGNVKLIVAALKAHNPKMPIVLCETFPCAPDNYRPVAEIRKINALYDKTWRDDPQVILAKTYALFAGPDGASLPKFLPDRVHPNAAGYARWAAALRPILAGLGLGDTSLGRGGSRSEKPSTHRSVNQFSRPGSVSGAMGGGATSEAGRMSYSGPNCRRNSGPRKRKKTGTGRIRTVPRYVCAPVEVRKHINCLCIDRGRGQISGRKPRLRPSVRFVWRPGSDVRPQVPLL